VRYLAAVTRTSRSPSKPTPKKEVTALLDAAYDPDEPDERWLDALAERIQPLFDGTPVVVFRFARDDARGVIVSDVVARGAAPAQVATFVHATKAAGPDLLRQAYFGSPQVATLSDVVGAGALRSNPLASAWSAATGVRDFFAAKAFQTDGSGIGVGALLPAVESVSERERWRWERLAAHVAAAGRVRERAEPRADGLPAGTEAVFDPKRGVTHAEGPAVEARDALEAAVRRRDRGRNLSLWPALVEGRWSLVDRIEADGRRFVLARKNEPAAPGPRTLSPRERQVVSYTSLGQAPKLIAYELGISESSVRTLLDRAKKKLGAKSRADLASLAWTASAEVDE
jgi:DNA-binding CsgD family transcriptional regulator